MKKFIIPLIALIFWNCSGTKITDEAADSFYMQFQNIWKQKDVPSDKLEKITLEILDTSKVRFQDMSVRQLNRASSYTAIARSVSLSAGIAENLKKFCNNEDIEGAAAAMNIYLFSTQDKRGDAAMKALQHPCINRLLADSLYSGETVSSLITISSIDSLAAKSADILANNLMALSDRSFKYVLYLFQKSVDKKNMDDATLNRLRISLLKKNAAIMKSGEITPAQGAANKQFLDSRFAQRKLIGSEAPEIEFIWNSEGKIKKLSDYKGKVVLLDFWATWCGPCFGAFPNIRALQKRYEDYDVEIIGITSIQGRHVRRKDGKTERIDTQSDTLKEFRLMKEFIKDCDVNWKISFSNVSCFNKEYGVFGIPHVAIIDTKGIVRYNALRPYNPPFQEAEKIDALLKEAGKRFPAEMMSTENFAK